MSEKSIPERIVTMLRRGQRRRPITVHEVAERLDVDRRVVATALQRLTERGELRREELTDHQVVDRNGAKSRQRRYGYRLSPRNGGAPDA